MNKSYLYQATLAACLFLGACSGDKTESGQLEVIPLGAAFDQQAELKTSDCFKKIRYVPLETTDSILVGPGAWATVLNDWIVVTSGRKLCQLFDKQTGRFIRNIGHVGEDPEGYSTSHGVWLNPNANKLNFSGWNGKMVVYRADGSFDHIWTPPIAAPEFPAVASFDNLDADLTVGYYSATDSVPAHLALFRGDEIVREQWLPIDSKGEKAVAVDEIAMLSIRKDGGDGVLIIKYKDNRSSITSLGNGCFWHNDGEFYFRQAFNDTIYQVSADKDLQPVRVLDFGTHRWDYDDRFDDKKDAIYPGKFMENEDVILFRFLTNVYTDNSKTYNALYRKADGTVKVYPFEEKIADDMNGFLPLQPISISSAGEFAAVLPSEEVVQWFEDNAGKTDLPAAVSALKKVGEEDNPVVVIME